MKGKKKENKIFTKDLISLCPKAHHKWKLSSTGTHPRPSGRSWHEHTSFCYLTKALVFKDPVILNVPRLPFLVLKRQQVVISLVPGGRKLYSIDILKNKWNCKETYTVSKAMTQQTDMQVSPLLSIVKKLHSYLWRWQPVCQEGCLNLH